MLGLCTPYRMCVALALVLLFPGTALAERDATPAEAATVAFALQALGDTAIGDGAVNLPSGGRAKTGGFPWRFSPGAFPLALRGGARVGDLAPHDHRPGSQRPIAG